MKTLIVVDMQNDFITGALGTKEAVSILPSVKKKIAEYKNRGDEIVFTRDTHSKEYLDTNEGKHLPVPHCIEGTEGWNVVPEIDIPECEHIDKPTFGYSGWEVVDYGTGYSERNFDEIEIIGVCTDICVISNVLILKCLYPEINITVDASCCAGVTPEKHKAALKVKTDSGEYVEGIATVLKPFTRDTFGVAFKATYCEVNGKSYPIFKCPKEDSFKKSQKGCCVVYEDDNGVLTYEDGYTWEEACNDPRNLLEPIFKDGEMNKTYTLEEVRNTLHGGNF